MSDAELIQRAGQGDEAAYESLVREHQQAVFRLAYLLIGDADEAEDVAQETFIHALRALPQFDVTRPLRPWLLRITTNLAYNQRRTAKRYIAALRRLVWAVPDLFHPTDPIDTLRDDSQALWQAVQRLERSDQEIIYLRYFLELSVTETAEALAIAPGTVKSRLHRALERLHRVMDKEFKGLWEERHS